MRRIALVVAISAFALTLPASAQNLLTNGTFDHDLSAWQNIGGTGAVISWSSQDAQGSSSSGSMQIDYSGSHTGVAAAQCVPITAGDNYAVQGTGFIPAGQSTSVSGWISVDWYADAACNSSFLSASYGDALSGSGTWQTKTNVFQAPAGATHAKILPSVYESGHVSGVTITDRWDDISFGPVTSTCVADATHLCLTGSRFRVSVQWTDYNTNVTAAATAVPFVDESGFFYFQDPANIEIMVKVHDACTGYGHFWFFSAATTNVAYTITVVDTKTGQTKTYSNPAHVLSSANTDQASFSSCP